MGKTSLGMSIAKATGRKFVRMSLGGVRDEAEIRGHRRTYIGALPGQIIQSMKKAGTRNPVFMLDEVDKMAIGFPRRSGVGAAGGAGSGTEPQFQDHYLDVEYDLSQVLFVATANVLHTIPAAAAGPHGDAAAAWLHRAGKAGDCEAVSGEEAAREYRADASKNSLSVTGRCTEIIRNYTREAGVRNLEREIGNVCRKIARARGEERGESIRRQIPAENLSNSWA